jgi:hypothetical protein
MEKSIMLRVRMTPDDRQALKTLAEYYKTASQSEVIRWLISQKAAEILKEQTAQEPQS